MPSSTTLLESPLSDDIPGEKLMLLLLAEVVADRAQTHTEDAAEV